MGRQLYLERFVWFDHEAQTEEVHDGDSLVRTIPASHEAEIMMEILKHGYHVEVLESEWLREKVLNEMKVAVGNYS